MHFVEEYLNESKRIIDFISIEEIERVVNTLVEIRKSGGAFVFNWIWGWSRTCFPRGL